MVKKFAFATLAAAGMFAFAGTANAALTITNGDMENGATPGANQADAVDWFDTITDGAQNSGYWWESTWYGDQVSPNGTSVLGLSFMFENTNWAYQSLGVNDGGLDSLDLQFDIGSFTDAGSVRNMGLTLSVYSVDGTYAGGANNTDIDGATGATLVDSVTLGPVDIASGAMLLGQTASLDISGTSGSELILRLENVPGSTYVPGDGSSTAGGPWVAVDNISIVPEPASLVLIGLGGLAMLRRR